MYSSEGSHSGTLMYGSEGSRSVTLQLVVEPFGSTYVATGSSTFVTIAATEVSAFSCKFGKMYWIVQKMMVKSVKNS